MQCLLVEREAELLDFAEDQTVIDRVVAETSSGGVGANSYPPYTGLKQRLLRKVF